MASNKLRIYLKAYDHTLLDQSAKKIAEVAKKSGAEIAGPMPLPTKIRKYTVLRSVHVNNLVLFIDRMVQINCLCHNLTLIVVYVNKKINSLTGN